MNPKKLPTRFKNEAWVSADSETFLTNKTKAMTDFKKRVLYLSSGKQIRFYGDSMAIGPGLQIGEGSAPTIFAYIEQQNAAGSADAATTSSASQQKKSNVGAVQNPFSLTNADLHEIADYNIQLWMNLKNNLRKYGVDNPKVFNRDELR